MTTYGTCVLERGKWKIEAQPHVAMWLRRVFKGSVDGRSHLSVTDSDATCRDLLWFAERYALDITPRDHMERRAARHREDEAATSSLLSEGPSRVLPTYELALPPRDYQRQAAALLLLRRRLLLADDVGLGKTVSAICPMVAPGTLPALVVTLTHLPQQWAAEIRRFAPQLRVHIVTKGTPYPLMKKTRGQMELIEPPMPDVLVINYHKLSGWADELAGKIRYLVFDEVQELRRRTSDKYAAAAKIARGAEYRLGLSATPIYNYGDEFHSIFGVLASEELGTKSEFDATWGSDTGRVSDPLAFGSYLRDNALMLRRTRRDVARELPALSVVPHTIDSDTRILAQTDGRAFELARIVLDRNKQPKGAKFQASEELSGLVRQQTGIAKAAFVAEFVSLLCESGEKVLLFGWHHEVYGIWRAKLAHLKPVFFTGMESPTQKEAAKRAFVEGDAQVLVMSLRAGAGIDGLQKVCRTVVFGELDWSPGVHEQATGRIYRDGQADPVVAYYLLAEDGSDPIVADVLGVKRGQIEPVRNPGGATDLVQVDEDRVRRLAEDYLRQRGMTMPQASEAA